MAFRTIATHLHCHSNSAKIPIPNAKPIQAPAACTSFHAGPNFLPLFGEVVVGKLLLPIPVTASVTALRTEDEEVARVEEELREVVLAANTLVAAAGVDPVNDPERDKKESMTMSISSSFSN